MPDRAGCVRAASAHDVSGLEGKRVWVYYNIHKNCLSVRLAGKVVAHVDEIFLSDVHYRVQPAGRARVLREGRKNVHAFVVGKVSKPFETDGFDVVYYNPYKTETFERNNQPITKSSKCHIRGKSVISDKGMS